jgi:threonine synthase
MTLPSAPSVATGTGLPTALVCAGCGYAAPPDRLPLGCPDARPGDGVDHVLHRLIDPARLAFPDDAAANPFDRYRTLWHGYQRARAAGGSDANARAEIAALDAAVARVGGHGFVVTPLIAADELGAELGMAPDHLLVKDETRSVGGSHKARHLFGTLLGLRLAGEDDPTRPLAIASCGNAALAAAIVARAADRRLEVFVPEHADPAVLRRLDELAAVVTRCVRDPDELGDPTVRRMREAVAAGAVPFTCQGPENTLAIEGGLTLGYEIADDLRSTGRRLDRIVIQVGGGALAASVIQGLTEALALGAIERLPRVHAVQARLAHPLVRAHELVVARLRHRLGGRLDHSPVGLSDVVASGAADEELAWIARHRSAFMWPWTPEPHSVASGILDDETYDWLAVVRGMLASGGSSVLASEADLREANAMARRATGIDVDPTGSAGLAGLVHLRRTGEVSDDETCAVLFTGIRRDGGTP